LFTSTEKFARFCFRWLCHSNHPNNGGSSTRTNRSWRRSGRRCTGPKSNGKV